MLDFKGFGLGINSGLFAAAAVAVWFAGVRLSHDANAISKQLGIGHATLGLVLLAGVTSLPEIVVTIAAADAGHVDLAVNNLLGGVAGLVVVIAIIDPLIGRRPLTAVLPEPSLLLQGTLNILLLSIVGAGIVVGEFVILGAGVWTWFCLAGYVFSVWVLSQTEGRQPWLPADSENLRRRPRKRAASRLEKERSLSAMALWTAATAAVICVAGVILERSASAIAEATGLGSSLVGFVLVGFSTSLPEFSSALTAARLGFFTMALSDILGSNLLNVALIFLVDVVASGEPVLTRVGQFALFGTILSIALNAIYVAGIAERRNRTVLRMGIDSAAVLVIYAAGLVLLFYMR